MAEAAVRLPAVELRFSKAKASHRTGEVGERRGPLVVGGARSPLRSTSAR